MNTRVWVVVAGLLAVAGCTVNAGTEGGGHGEPEHHADVGHVQPMSHGGYSDDAVSHDVADNATNNDRGGDSQARTDHAHTDRGDGHVPHWGYDGDLGPAHWGDLDAGYHVCGDGMRQSPVDLSVAVRAAFDGVHMAYTAVPLEVVNNGHTVQVNYAPGSTLTVDGVRYRLVQFHFHSPSEHRVRGDARAMEAHLVHVSDDGRLAVVGVFLKTGRENPLLARIWPHLPERVDQPIHRDDVRINVADLLPAQKGYYFYNGSLTTPPCSEGVRWFVMDAPVEVSAAQVARFQELIADNNRPVQPHHNRFLLHRN